MKDKLDTILVTLTALFFLNIFGSFQYFSIIIIIYLGLKGNKLLWSLEGNSISIFMFGLSYFIFATFNREFNITHIYTFFLLPWLTFNLGKTNAIGIMNADKVVSVLLIFTISISSIFLFSIITTILDLGEISGRIGASSALFGRDYEIIEMNATIAGMHLSPLLSFLPVYIFGNKNQNKILMLIGSGFTLITLTATLFIMTRTTFILFIFSLFFVFWCNINLKKNRAGLFLLILISALTFNFITIDFQEIEITKGLYDRFQTDDLSQFGNRSQMWIKGLTNTLIYPFGGDKMEYSYYHNLWLDIRKVAGIIPMLFFIQFSAKSVASILGLLRNNNVTIQIRSLLGSIFLLLLLNMFMEPAIEASYIFFLFFIFFAGFVFQYQKNKLKKNLNNRIINIEA
jgi:hypothetical protein